MSKVSKQQQIEETHAYRLPQPSKGTMTFKEFLVVEALLAQADEWRVEQDEDGLVHLIDGEQTIRATMSAREWQTLCARNNMAGVHEGVFDAVRTGAAYARGAAAQFRPAMKSMRQSGQADAIKRKAVLVAANAAQQIKKLGPKAQQALVNLLNKMGSDGQLGLQLYVQGGKLAAQQQDNIDVVPAAFRAQGKPKVVQTKGRPAGEFSYAWPGKTESANISDEVIEEAVGAFLKGVGKFAAKKINDKLEQSISPSVRTMMDMWQAGKLSSAQATVVKIAQQLVKYAKALQQLQQGA